MAASQTQQRPTSDRSWTQTVNDRLPQESGALSVLHEFLSEPACKFTNNLLETWDSYYVQVCLPGADLECLQIQVVARQVTVRGKHRIPTIEAATHLRREIATGQFYDTFTMPGEVDGDKAEARYDRGILTVRLPKVAYLKPASIKIQTVT